MRAFERFLNYIEVDTSSREGSASCPSTPGQLELGHSLVNELHQMGIENADMDSNGYVYATLPATAEGFHTIGLIAHMDTVDCVPAAPMRARILKDYDGQDILLECGDRVSPTEYPELAKRRGKRLIVTDGRTLLGADDKAGVAEIMTVCEELIREKPAHGDIQIAFTPDEEIGCGADLFDVKRFHADYAYTLDGDEIGGIEFENFNAASLKLTFHGKSVHPGSAKHKMINAARIAAEFDAHIPYAETPEMTENYEGFYHLCEIGGAVESAHSEYILRDHDRERFEERKRFVQKIADQLNEKYGAGTVDCLLKDSYYNMAEIIRPRMEIIHRAEAAWKAAGIEPFLKPIRGGTDGSRLSFMGLPCPNLGTGGMNFHGRHEMIAVEDMDKTVEMLKSLLTAQTTD